MFSNIAQGRSPEQCITNGMQQYVCIAVAECSFMMCYLYTTQPKLTAFYQPVIIHS